MPQFKKPTNGINASITAIGGYVPDEILSNKKLESMVDTNDAWIQSKTGIKERRILNDPNKATSYLAVMAAKKTYFKKSLSLQLLLQLHRHCR
jgi:3-oxoacyl-[acyl-carrier-protein] synthase-3